MGLAGGNSGRGARARGKLMAYLYLIAYDGALFHGFVGHPASVVSFLRRAIGEITGVGSRTDPGVSAIGNVVKSPNRANLGQVNSKLPKGVWAWGLAEVPDDFNTRRARVRRYAYFAPYCGEDVDLMREAASMFLGARDFSAFVKKRGERISTTSIIYDIEIEGGEYLVIKFAGRGFKNKMLRKITWALLAVGRGVLTLDYLAELLERGQEVVPSAPSEGLVLLEIDYGVRFETDPKAISDVVKYFLRKAKLTKALSRAYFALAENVVNYFK